MITCPHCGKSIQLDSEALNCSIEKKLSDSGLLINSDFSYCRENAKDWTIQTEYQSANCHHTEELIELYNEFTL